MIIGQGYKVLIVHRRLFESDHSRYFVGIVDGYEAGIVKVRGNTWIKDAFGGGFIRKEDTRTKIFSIASGTLIIYELPQNTDISAILFDSDKEGRLWLSDGRGLRVDLSESEHARPKASKRVNRTSDYFTPKTR